jgi:hypothetical protein
MQRAPVVLLVVGALLTACAAELPHQPTPVAVAERSPDQCARLLDPITKNTDLVRLFASLDGTYAGRRPEAAVETEKAALEREWGVDKVVMTLPLTSTYDEKKGVARFPTDPAEGDSIFIDTAARDATANTLGGYTLVTDPTNPVNERSYPAADALGPPTQPRVSRGFRYGLALVDLDPRAGGRSGNQWASAKGGLEVPLTPERARAGYGRLAVKIVAELVPPGILTGQEIHAATKTTGAWEVDLRYVTGRTVCAAIVTAVDGEAVKRLR